MKQPDTKRIFAPEKILVPKRGEATEVDADGEDVIDEYTKRCLEYGTLFLYDHTIYPTLLGYWLLGVSDN